MDKLFECAKAFEGLLNVEYHMLIGRKGKAVELRVKFEKVEFHHLIGLHKLKDLRLARGNREKIFGEILSGKITLSDIEKSQYYDKIKNRIEPFARIETIFDQNNLIFRYNERKQTFSMIEAEYLLSTPCCSTDVYIFLDKKSTTGDFFCRSFFPKEEKDYTEGQAVYTLLWKEKTDVKSGMRQLQYDRISEKNENEGGPHELHIRE